MIKKILKITSIVIAVIIIAAIVLPFAFKSKIEAKLKDEINKSVNAKVDWKDYSLGLFRNFPNFNLSLDELTVIGVDSFATDTLANIKSLNITVDLMSVINGSTYKIKKINLDEPNLLLKILKSGKANWDIAKPSETTDTTATEQPSDFKLALQKLSITKGNIIYDDQSTDMRIEAKNVNSSIKGDMTADVTSLSTKSTIEFLTFAYGGMNYLNKVNTEATADIEADLKNSKYTFKENEFRLNQLFLGLDGFISMPSDDIDMDLKLNAKKTEFKNFLSLLPALYAKDFDNIDTKGKLALDGYVKGTYNDKKMPSFAVNIQVDDGMYKYPDLPKAVTNINIKTSITNTTSDIDNTVIDISKFHFEMGSNPVDIKMNIKTPVSDPQINGTIKGKINLAEVKDFYPLEKDQQMNGTINTDVTLNGKLSSIENKKYEDFKATGQVSINGLTYKSNDFAQGITINDMKLLFSPQYVELASCSMIIGKSDLKATGRIDNLLSYFLKNDILKGTFTSSSKLMDLNEFMQPSQTATTAQKTDTASTMSVIEIPANIDFVANATFGKVLYDNMEMTNVVGVLKIKDQQVNLENLKMNMLDGQLTMSGYYSTKNPKQPEINFNLDINQFDIAKTSKTFLVVQKLAPVANACSGKFSTKMNMTTSLDGKMTPVIKTMSGKGLLNTSSITVQGFGPLTKLGEALKIEKFKKLILDKVNLSFSFADGKIFVEPFDFTYGQSKGKISGSNSFDQTIDYVMNLEIPKSEFGGAANGVLNNLTSKANSKGANVTVGDVVKVDAIIGGTITKPTISLGLKGTMNEAIDDLKDKAKTEIDNKKKEAEDKVKAEADKQKQAAEDKAKAVQDSLKKAAEEKAKKEKEDLKNKLKNKIKF
ncbi:MAG TPA: AsmA-like C-terminal region-containing protein [Bacteroidales bacterium]|nr:AsmA-like C-terminal region-containing protein [Bacteroidales bacterium]HPS16922.1 AsmA-like C-terminal region-containing protein [Bacteroidales bacterium]